MGEAVGDVHFADATEPSSVKRNKRILMLRSFGVVDKPFERLYATKTI